MDPFATLPEETVSEILSRTSPLDASRFAVISKGFKSSAEADYVWKKFIPSDWLEIVSRSGSPVVYTTMKELYFSLCHSPISLDGGRLIRTSCKLRSVCWLDIRGKINVQTPSKNTVYGAYLVFKLAGRCNGVGSADAAVRFVNDEEEGEAEARAAVVYLQRGNLEIDLDSEWGRLPWVGVMDGRRWSWGASVAAEEMEEMWRRASLFKALSFDLRHSFL